MSEHENPSDTVVPGHLQEYYSGIAGFPQNKEHPPELDTLSSNAEEIFRLQRLIQEKDHAIFKAVMSGTDLQHRLDQATAEAESLKTELAVTLQQSAQQQAAPQQPDPGALAGLSPETQQEVNRQRREWMRVQKTLEREHAERKAELVQVRGQAHKFQHQLELESRARRMETAQFSAKIATLEQSLAAARSEVSKAHATAGKSKARRSAGIALACVGVAICAVAAWTQMSASSGAPAPTVSRQTPSQVPTRPLQTGAGFQRSLGRLNEALSSFGNRSPEEVLREVRLHSPDHSVCSFQWNDGQPALLVGGQGLNRSLAGALASCAVAVEHYRP